MQRKNIIVSLALMVLVNITSANEILTGDVRLSCEANLCLSSASPPAECTPALTRYFGITRFRASATRRARADFLRICPIVTASPIDIPDDAPEPETPNTASNNNSTLPESCNRYSGLFEDQKPLECRQSAPVDSTAYCQRWENLPDEQKPRECQISGSACLLYGSLPNDQKPVNCRIPNTSASSINIPDATNTPDDTPEPETPNTTSNNNQTLPESCNRYSGSFEDQKPIECRRLR